MNIELTIEQKSALEAQHRKCRDRRVCDRIRCVLLSAQGWSSSMIAQSQLIHETTVLRHIADYLQSAKLAPENGGSQSHLSEAQTGELIAHLTVNLLPTTQSVISLVKDWWGIQYTVPGMNKWLHRNGFSYKKPTGVPHKYSADLQQRRR